MVQARANGDVTAEFIDVSSSNLLSAVLAFKAPAIGGLGVNIDAGTSESTTTNASYLGDDGWVDWTACTP
jgi:hypothetical protein